MPERLFIFVQLEFPWLLGPPDGRYLLRAAAGGEAQHVVVLGTLAAGRAGARGAATGTRRGRWSARRRQRRGGRQATPAPEPVATARVTVIDPVPLGAEHQARAWLAELDSDRDVRAAV